MLPSARDVTAEDANPKRWVWVLHGFLGSGENWLGFARQLVARRPELGCALVDLRLHGGSRDAPPPHTMSAVAGDLQELAAARGGPEAVVGHSFGGRAALAYAAEAPSGLRQVFVLDAAPATEVQREQTATGRVLNALQELPARFESRQAFTAALQARGATPVIAAWLAKNLERQDGALRFTLPLQALQELLAAHDESDYWWLLSAPPPGLELQFVLAGAGSVLSLRDRQRLRELSAQGRLRVHELAAAGHWLHVDDAEGLLALLASEL